MTKVAPRDVEGYRCYSRHMGTIFDVYLAILSHPMQELRKVSKKYTLVKITAKKELIPTMPLNFKLGLRNLDKCVRSNFQDCYMQLMFRWENMYVGLFAYRCMGLFTMMACMGCMGYCYSMGGMISIPRSSKEIAEAFGVEIRLNSPVKRVTVQYSEAKGVRLRDYETLSVRAVISNTNSRCTYRKLVGEENLPGWVSRTIRRHPSYIPAPIFHMELSERLESMKGHMSLVETPRRQFDGIWNEFYDQGLLYRPDDDVYIIIDMTFDDPSMAPSGKQVISLIYIVPYRLKHHDWDDIAEEWAWEVICFLDRRIYPGLRE